MGCGVWLEVEGGTEQGDAPPWFDSDSKAFGNWLFSLVRSSALQSELGAAGKPLLAVHGDWIAGPKRWTAPELLLQGTSQLRQHLEDGGPRTRPSRALATYAARGYGTDPALELATDLRDVEAMAAWAIERGKAKVAFEVDEPDPRPLGVFLTDVWGEPSELAQALISRALREPLSALGFAREKCGYLRFVSPGADDGASPERVEFRIRGGRRKGMLAIANGAALNLSFLAPEPTASAKPGFFDQLRAALAEGGIGDASDLALSPSAGFLEYRDLDHLDAHLRALAPLFEGVLQRHRILAGATLPIESVRKQLADPTFAQWAASNERTSPLVLRELARSSDDEVFARLAGNPTMDPVLLSELAKQASPVRRLAVAMKCKVPEILARLAGDQEASVRVAVAKNRATPTAALAVLAEDPDPMVRGPALRNPNRPRRSAP